MQLIRKLNQRKLAKKEKGGTDFVEMLILLGFIALVCITIVTTLGETVEQKFSDQNDTIDTINTGPG